MVIAGLLNVTGNVAPVSVEIPDFKDRPPGLNGDVDSMGHGFVEIYINEQLDTFKQIRGYLMDALNTN